MKDYTTCNLMIGNSSYCVQGGDVQTLKEIAEIIGLKYDLNP